MIRRYRHRSVRYGASPEFIELLSELGVMGVFLKTGWDL